MRALSTAILSSQGLSCNASRTRKRLKTQPAWNQSLPEPEVRGEPLCQEKPIRREEEANAMFQAMKDRQWHHGAERPRLAFLCR